jgi:predicted NAD/FAD-dependent oxidoreductase
MNALVADLAQRHDVTFECLVKGLVHDGRHWWLVLEGERRGPFDAVVVATPAEQAAPLLSLHAFPMARAAAGSASQACWTAMMAWAEPLPLDWTVWRGEWPLAWVGAIRPSRGAWPGPGARLLGDPGQPDWSRQHLEQTPDEVIARLPHLCRSHRDRPARSAGGARASLALCPAGPARAAPRCGTRHCAWAPAATG